jgi:hypothetical protein
MNNKILMNILATACKKYKYNSYLYLTGGIVILSGIAFYMQSKAIIQLKTDMKLVIDQNATLANQVYLQQQHLSAHEAKIHKQVSNIQELNQKVISIQKENPTA